MSTRQRSSDTLRPKHPMLRGGALVPASMNPPEYARGVYGITVAADLAGLGVQTLRLYESRGLLTPDRTGGGTRQYSPNDIHRLRRISDLQGEGINLAGIAMVLDLQDQNNQLRALHKHRPNPTQSTRLFTMEW